MEEACLVYLAALRWLGGLRVSHLRAYGRVENQEGVLALSRMRPTNVGDRWNDPPRKPEAVAAVVPGSVRSGVSRSPAFCPRRQRTPRYRILDWSIPRLSTTGHRPWVPGIWSSGRDRRLPLLVPAIHFQELRLCRAKGLVLIIHANLLRTRLVLHLSPLCQNADLDGFQHACVRQPDTTG